MSPFLNIFTGWRFVLAASVLPLLTASAANRHIRAGATGANNGSDWANAYASVPATLVRGDIYYIAAGNYGGYTFSTAESGTTFSTLKKATIADHGTATGWNDSYASGQAAFTHFGFTTGYLMVDGATRWGIKVTCGTPGRGIETIRVGGASISSVTFQYVESAGPAGSAPYPYQIGGDCTTVHCCFFQGPTLNDLAFKNCYFHGSTTIFQTAGTVRLLVENCILADSRIDYGPSGYDPNKPHDNIAFIQQGTDTIFRFNTISNWDVTGIYPNGNSPGTHQVHGNYFQGAERGAVWFYATIASNSRWLIYGNTFKDIANQAIYHDSGAAPVGGATNNIFFNCGGNSFGALAHDYNWYSGANKESEPNGIAGGAVNPFLAVPGIVSTIGASYPRNKGFTLASEYARDITGIVRGSDGSWDIGASEYGGPSTNPVISVSPSSLNFASIAVASSNDLSFTVQNVGGGTVAGTASVAAPFSIVSGGTYSLGSNQAQTVTIRYRPTTVGSHSQAVSFTGGGGATVTAMGSAWIALPGISFDSYLGTIAGPFITNSGGYVSQSIETGVADGGRAVYGFTITNSGNHYIYASVNAPNDAANSFFVNIDSEPVDPGMIWDILPYTADFEPRVISWRGNGTYDNPQFVNKQFYLPAGAHQLIIRGREPNTLLGRITLVPAVPPPANLRVMPSP